MIDCPQADLRDLLPDLLHGRLAPLRRAAVERHLAACSVCRAELALLGGLRAIMTDVSPVDVASIARALPTYRAPARSMRSWQIAAAAAAIALGGSALAIARHASSPALGVESVRRVATPRADVSPVRIASTSGRESTASVGRAIGTTGTSHRVVVGAVHALAVEGATGDLSELELRELLAGIHSLKALPSASAETDNASLAPALAGGEL